MKVILYAAVSADGFIATKDGDSDWVSEIDTPIFEAKIKEAGCLVVGRRTFDQYHGELYPLKGVLNIVLTTNTDRDPEDETVFVDSPKNAIEIAKEKGFGKIMVIGGGRTNGSFLKQNLIDEMFLDVHPLILGEGIKLFEAFEGNLKLSLIDRKDLSKSQTLLHYKVIK